MDTTKALIILGILIVLGGGAWFVVEQKKDAAMMDKENVMMEKEEGVMAKDATTDEAGMMKKEDDAMMEKSDDAMMKKDEGTMMEEGTMMQKGSYETYAPEKLAKADNGNVVLFFRASWCPTCRAADADIRAHLSDIPGNLTILDVNYDTATALKQKYGITYQHTFVQVDSTGNQIAKWSGSPTLSDIVSRVQ